MVFGTRRDAYLTSVGTAARACVCLLFPFLNFNIAGKDMVNNSDYEISNSIRK